MRMLNWFANLWLGARMSTHRCNICIVTDSRGCWRCHCVTDTRPNRGEQFFFRFVVNLLPVVFSCVIAIILVLIVLICLDTLCTFQISCDWSISVAYIPYCLLLDWPIRPDVFLYACLLGCLVPWVYICSKIPSIVRLCRLWNRECRQVSSHQHTQQSGRFWPKRVCVVYMRYVIFLLACLQEIPSLSLCPIYLHVQEVYFDCTL